MQQRIVEIPGSAHRTGSLQIVSIGRKKKILIRLQLVAAHDRDEFENIFKYSVDIFYSILWMVQQQWHPERNHQQQPGQSTGNNSELPNWKDTPTCVVVVGNQ